MRSRTTTLRVALAVVSAAAVAVLAVGASSASAAPQRTQATTIHILAQTTSQVAWNAWISNYKRVNPNVDIQITFLPVSSYPQAILTQFQAGNGPDVLYTIGGSGQINSTLNLASANRLADLSKEPWTKRIPPAARALVTNGKKVYALPLGLVPHGVVYNVAAFREMGLKIPTTFGQLLSICTAIKAKGKVPFEIAGSALLNTGVFAQMIAASTVYAAKPDWNTLRMQNKVTFAGTPTWGATLQRIVAMKNAGCFQPSPAGTGIPQMFAALGTGQALMLPGPSIAIGQVKAVNPTAEIAQFPFPGAKASQTRAMAGYTDSVAVNAASSVKSEAIKFVDFIAREGQSRIYANVGAAISLHDSNVGKVPPTAVTFGPYLKTGKIVANPNSLWVNGDVYTALGNAVTGLLTGQTSSISGALQQMDAAWNKG